MEQRLSKKQELQPDLIVLDIGLPKLNGIEAAPRMSELSPGSKILFLSQDNDADSIQAALSAGACGYVHKLSAGTELLSAVAAVLQGQRFVTGGISYKESNGQNPTTATAWSDIDAGVPS